MVYSRITKQLVIFIVGIFFIALGATFSIRANIGVSPVTALPYAWALISTFSVGVMTVVANLLYISLQAIILRKFHARNFAIQLLTSFLFGFFIDFTLWMTQIFPDAHSYWLIIFYFVCSLCILSFGIVLTITSKLPTMPYDSLTNVISQKWVIPFGKSKMICDSINVGIALIICLIALRTLGSIGIGTFIAAYGLGKLIGVYMKHVQPSIHNWVFEPTKEIIN